MKNPYLMSVALLFVTVGLRSAADENDQMPVTKVYRWSDGTTRLYKPSPGNDSYSAKLEFEVRGYPATNDRGDFLIWIQNEYSDRNREFHDKWGYYNGELQGALHPISPRLVSLYRFIPKLVYEESKGHLLDMPFWHNQSRKYKDFADAFGKRIYGSPSESPLPKIQAPLINKLPERKEPNEIQEAVRAYIRERDGYQLERDAQGGEEKSGWLPWFYKHYDDVAKYFW